MHFYNCFRERRFPIPFQIRCVYLQDSAIIVDFARCNIPFHTSSYQDEKSLHFPSGKSIEPFPPLVFHPLFPQWQSFLDIMESVIALILYNCASANDSGKVEERHALHRFNGHSGHAL